MADADGLVCAYLLEGQGAGRQMGWAEITSWSVSDGVLWVHLDRAGARAQQWLREHSGLDPVIVDALLAEETRPRSLGLREGLLVILRGVNLNPGAEPEDMVSLRMWVEPRRIISTRMRPLMAINDVRESIAAQRGPHGAADFVVQVASRLVDRMGPVIDGLDDTVSALEDELLTRESREIRRSLRDARREAIALRRYLAPQRDALARLQTEEQPWFELAHKARLREVADRVTRYVEDLDEVRDRAAVIQDELVNRLSEQMNKTMYLLSVVAAIMLPLGVITGLLGVNVGGIPGADSAWGFGIVVVMLTIVVALQIVIFRRLKWI